MEWRAYHSAAGLARQREGCVADSLLGRLEIVCPPRCLGLTLDRNTHIIIDLEMYTEASCVRGVYEHGWGRGMRLSRNCDAATSS
jgi:hypothetical protein